MDTGGQDSYEVRLRIYLGFDERVMAMALRAGRRCEHTVRFDFERLRKLAQI